MISIVIRVLGHSKKYSSNIKKRIAAMLLIINTIIENAQKTLLAAIKRLLIENFSYINCDFNVSVALRYFAFSSKSRPIGSQPGIVSAILDSVSI